MKGGVLLAEGKRVRKWVGGAERRAETQSPATGRDGVRERRGVWTGQTQESTGDNVGASGDGWGWGC